MKSRRSLYSLLPPFVLAAVLHPVLPSRFAPCGGALSAVQLFGRLAVL